MRLARFGKAPFAVVGAAGVICTFSLAALSTTALLPAVAQAPAQAQVRAQAATRDVAPVDKVSVPPVTGSLTPNPGTSSTAAAKSKAAPKGSQRVIPDGGRVIPPADPGPLVPITAEEQAFLTRMDSVLEPLYTYTPSEADIAGVRDAVQAAGAGNANRAMEIEKSIQDAAARKIVRWVLMRNDASGASPAEIEEFRRTNPDFPEQTLLRLRAEEALLTRVGDTKEIKSFFEKSPPQTGAGLSALAAAHLGEGNRDKARDLAVRAWREFDMSLRSETVFLNTLGGLLSEADHKARLDRLLMKDFRYAKERGDRANLVRRMIPYLTEPEQKKAQARLAVFLRQKDAPRAIMTLPADAMQDWGVYFSVVQLNRRAGTTADDEGPQKVDDTSPLVDPVKPDAAAPDPGKVDPAKSDAGKLMEAWRLILAAPTDPAKIVSPDDWWIERRVNAYEALRAGQPKTAYDLVRDAGPLSANPIKDAQMLAGWIALRQLNDAKTAERHFQAMRKAADGPISISASEYWLARTAQALGDGARSTQHLRNAVPYFDTFYGQLARQALEPASTRLTFSLPAEPLAVERDKFVARDAVKAIMIARRAGAEHLVRPLLAHLRYYLINSPGEVALVAHLSHVMGDTQWSMRTGKAALVKGQNLVSYAFPTHAFPNYQPLRSPVEPALLLGIARQESEFNTLTLSGAGARGVLQVMPATARYVCRDYRVKCDIPRLATDAAYNTMIASAYIGDRLADYSGSYVMTLAGYNAGPGRVRQWVREFGDPRSPDVDPVDWIERIPFEETREYVKKVLANIQVYRARLGQSEQALQIMADLNRARGAVRGAPPAAASNAPPARVQ